MKEVVAWIIKSSLQKVYLIFFTNELTQQQILDLIETPKQDEFGDAAFPCFSLAKQYKKSTGYYCKGSCTEIK